MTSAPSDHKAILRQYLQEARDALIWKTEGLSERELRLPRTPTGTSLLGLVKHCTATEIGYLGYTFGRPWPTPDEMPYLRPLFDDTAEEEPEADTYATADESAEFLIDLYRRVSKHGDETIEQLDLDSPGRVPWWNDGDVTLHRVLVHLLAEVQRHAGHADILREGIDGAAGLSRDNSNLSTPDADRAGHVARLRAIAEQFPA